mgnify:CR=1 FL=1
MSTQYSVVNMRITEEVAEFQGKVSAIQAECLRMIREASVSADLQEVKEDLIDKLSVRYSLLRHQRGHPLWLERQERAIFHGVLRMDSMTLTQFCVGSSHIRTLQSVMSMEQSKRQKNSSMY